VIFVAFVMLIPGFIVLFRKNLRLTHRNTLTGWRRITVAIFLLAPFPLVLLASVAAAAVLVRTQVDPARTIRAATVFGWAAIVSGWIGALTFGLLINPDESPMP